MLTLNVDVGPSKYFYWPFFEEDLFKMDDDDFFVGWLPAPKHLVSFLTPVAGIVIVSIVITAAVLATYQKHPGTGQWEDGRVVTLRGLAGTDPYAMLWVEGEDQREPMRTFLLVEDGKFGALPRIARLVNHKTTKVPVEVRGTILHRDDRWMLALESDESSVRVLDSKESMSLSIRLLNQPAVRSKSIALRGESIDPKCYLGAMKPGGGKTHKACAMRCIAGGIPPMLVTRDSAMRESYYLLVDENGNAANEVVYPFVGDQVELSGHLETANAIRKLFISPNTIRRL